MTRRQQAVETKARIVKYAWQQIWEKGYEETTISDICRAAGISNGNFYHYFASKDDMLLFGYMRFDKFVEEEFSKRPFETVTDAIFALINEQVSGVCSVGPKLQNHMFQAQLRLRGGYVIDEERYFPRYLRQLVDRAVETGEIHPSHSAEEVTRTILQVARGVLFDWSLRTGSFSAEQRVMQTLNLIFTALRQPRVPDREEQSAVSIDPKAP